MRFNSHTRVACFLACDLFAFSARGQSTPQASPAIHIDVERVNVSVVITDARGQFVSGLHRDDFHLFDDGTEQRVTDFLSSEDPAQVLLLIEAGPAVYLLESGHVRAVQALLDGLSVNDRVAIARYNEGAEPILDFTADKRIASTALDRLRFNVGFGQLNLASSMLTALDWLERVPGKKSLIVLSTGVDTSSESKIQELLNRTKTADVLVLLISLGADLRTAQPTYKKRARKIQPAQDKAEGLAQAFADADEELRSIAAANGGRAYFPKSSRDFASVFAEVAQVVRHEYSLGFIPAARDAKVHSIDVRISDSRNAASDAEPASRYRIDHRQAYLAPQ